MQTWNLNEIPTPDGSRSPVVLASADDARAVLIGLASGQELGDHQVKERAWLVVVDGRVRIEAGGEAIDARVGTLATFAPDETHRVAAVDGPARVLLFLSPWPGEGHYRGEERSLG
jgi:quercetin dioxygenase-like cupin family protein